jgi:hypothetical protein
MKAGVRFVLAHALALPLCVSVAFAQVTELGPADQPAAVQPGQGQPDSGQPQQAQPAFAQQELDQMLAPIALYPDSLLSQILMASTYPIEVVQAARWSKANSGITGDQAVQAVEQNNWDPSVKSLVAFPQVLSMMDEKLDWTERLGDAFLSQQQQVMDTVQGLRQKAQAAGNLQSNENVRVEPQGQTIVIEQANPQVVYVPYYDPTYIYGPWWYPAYPPVFWGPWPGYYARPGFGAGFFWGGGITIGAGFFFGAFDWQHRHATVVNINNFYYRAPLHPVGPPGGWQHDPGHRRGVPYRDAVLRREFARPGARPDVVRSDARREFRGNEQPRLQGPTVRPDFRNAPANRPEQRDRVQPRAEGNARPNVAEVARPETRNVPQTNASTVPRLNVPEPRNVAQPNVGAVPRPNLPNVAQAPRVPNLPAAPAILRPHIFEGVGQGAVVRDSSQRGNTSSQRMAPQVRPAAQPAPAARPAAAQRPSGGGGHNEGQQRQQR